MKNLPFVSVVVCTHNRADSLGKLALNSLARVDYPNFEVVVIDDASTDSTKETAEKYKARIKNLRYIKNPRHKLLCYARNLGIKNARGDIIAFIDDDCAVSKNWLKELVKPYLKDKKVMAAGGKTYIKNSKKLFNPQKQIYGCNMSFRKEALQKFLFDENLKYSFLGDEVELLERMRRDGIKTAYSGNASVRHFIRPGKHRNTGNIKLSLNMAYLSAKKSTLAGYYFLLAYTSIFGPKVRKEWKMQEMFDCVGCLKGELKRGFPKSILKLPYISYALLIEIPFNAKFRTTEKTR